jgi:hypothetical protein
MTRTRLSPPAATAVALVVVTALALALAATAATGYAAGKAKAKGDAIIKKHSLSANRLKADTVTGAEVAESSLGTVPRAAAVDSLPAPSPLAGLVLGTGWASVPDAGTRPVGYRKDALGVVHLQGAVQRSSGTNDVIGQLPPGFRPAGKIFLLALANGDSATLEIDPDGAVRWFGGGSELFISLEAITFIADQ